MFVVRRCGLLPCCLPLLRLCGPLGLVRGFSCSGCFGFFVVLVFPARTLLGYFALLLFTLLSFSLFWSPLVTRFFLHSWMHSRQRHRVFYLICGVQRRISSKNPVSGHLCVSSVWENPCHCVNAFCLDKSAAIVGFIYGGVGADLGGVPA